MLGAYFALCAHLEAASVVAFDSLCDELAFHDFPLQVLDACSRAAREETAHAEAVGALATRFGERPPPLGIRRDGAMNAPATQVGGSSASAISHDR